MPSASSLTFDTQFLGLFVGPSGAGKTPAACSWLSKEGRAAGKRIKIYDFDRRLDSILRCPWIDRSFIDYDQIPPRMKGGVLPWLNRDLANLQGLCQLDQCPYETLIVDSLTQQTYAFLCDARPLTHANDKGRSIGALLLEGPDDYRYESSGTYSMLAFFRSLPIKNIIFTAHIIDKYDKQDPTNMMSPSVVVGKRLSIRDKLAANIPTTFGHIFEFDRRMVGDEPHFYVKFYTNLARTSYPLPLGEHDITNRDFYKAVQDSISHSTTTEQVKTASS